MNPDVRREHPRTPAGRDDIPQQHLRHGDDILTAGEVACFASHCSVWRDAAARGAPGPLLVLEDDADFDAAFVQAVRGAVARLPPDWDILWVGSCYEEDHQAGAPQEVAHRYAPCSGERVPCPTHQYASYDPCTRKPGELL